MTHRILDFLRSSPILAAGVVLLSAGLFWFVRAQPRDSSSAPHKQVVAKLPLVRDGGQSLKESPVSEVNKHFTPWQLVPLRDKKPELPAAPQVVSSGPLPKLIHDYELIQKMPPKGEPPKPASITLPFGSVIACRLLQGVECGSDAMPVIAELLQPVRDAAGKNWMPKGTRIHGNVKSSRSPGRIESAGGWTMILLGQKLLDIQASVQDRDFDSVHQIYGINDGTAGISGKVIQMKKGGWRGTILREGIAAATDVSKERVTTALGEIELGSARNAALRGVSSLTQGLIPKGNVEATETFVSVAAGKEFYLYIDSRTENHATEHTREIEVMLRERGQLVEQLRRETERRTNHEGP